MSPKSHPRTSEILAGVIANADGHGDISIREVMQLMGHRAFGLAILVFSLPNSLPIPSPPGFSAVTGAPIVLFAVQMLIGRETLWLPRKINDYRFSRAKFALLLSKALPYIEKIERFLHPRFGFMHTWTAERMVGLVFVLLSLLLALPIPLGNFLPGVSMTLIALGLLERDGALMLVGILSGITAALVIIFAFEAVLAPVFRMITGLF